MSIAARKRLHEAALFDQFDSDKSGMAYLWCAQAPRIGSHSCSLCVGLGTLDFKELKVDAVQGIASWLSHSRLLISSEPFRVHGPSLQ